MQLLFSVDPYNYQPEAAQIRFISMFGFNNFL